MPYKNKNNNLTDQPGNIHLSCTKAGNSHKFLKERPYQQRKEEKYFVNNLHLHKKNLQLYEMIIKSVVG